MTKLRSLLLAASTLLAFAAAPVAHAKNAAVEAVQKTTESQVRHLIEPLLDKYCPDQCKLLNVATSVDLDVPEELAPGFDDFRASSSVGLAPTLATLRLLVDDRVGPNSRHNLLELLQTHLDNLDYPTKVDVKLAHFPNPVGSDSKVAELREKVAKQFQARVNELIAQFCPEQCLLADFTLKTDVVNGEESQYGTPGEYVQDGGTAIRIKEIGGTLLMDDSLSPEERANIVEMAKLRTNTFKNVSLEAKAMKFPHPTLSAGRAVGPGGYGYGSGNAADADRRLSSETKNSQIDNKSVSNHSNNSNSSDTRDAKSTSSSTNSKQDTSDSRNQSSTNNDNRSSSTSSENQNKQERFERYEKIERVESGDAIKAELQKFKLYGLIFACSILSLLIFIAMAAWKPARKEGPGSIQRVISSLTTDPVTAPAPMAAHSSDRPAPAADERHASLSKRFECERLVEELMAIFATHPKVAKYVFSRILTEEGVEITAQYIHLFGEGIVVDMLRDPSLQSDMNELMEFYAKTPMEIEGDEKLDLLRKLHNRTVAGKLIVLGNRSSNLFEFLSEMDSLQILEMIRNESLTVKAIVLTQCDPQKRAAIYQHLDEEIRMRLLSELSRIDHLPRDYIFNVSNALKRKRRENPRLNTESLPGSEVLVSLLERTGMGIQRSVVKNLELSNPDSARTVKGKLVSIDTLSFLRDSQLLEVVLSLKHEELLQFLKGAPETIRRAIFAKSPKELVLDLEEELAILPPASRESYAAVERKVLNRMKLMANEGLINLVETNERMFANGGETTGFVQGAPSAGGAPAPAGTNPNLKKVAGW